MESQLGAAVAFTFWHFEESRCFRWQSLLVALLIVWSVGVEDARAGDESAEARSKRTKAVLEGVRQERQRFKSGVAVISGTVVRNLRGTKVKGPIAGLYAFDSEKNHLRYDNAEPQYSWSIDADFIRKKKALSEIEPKLFRMRLGYLRNSEYAAFWTHDGPTTRCDIELLKPDKDLGRRTITHHLYDVRAAGLFTYEGFEKNCSLKQCLESLRFESVAKEDKSGEKEGRIDIELINGGRLIVETHDGFRPIELMHSDGTARYVTKTRWKREQKIDVPVEMSVEVDNPDRKYHIEYHLKYDWKSVNQPVDPVYFDYHSFQDVPLNLHMRVYDSRGERPIKIKDWTGKDVVPLPHDKKPATLSNSL